MSHTAAATILEGYGNLDVYEGGLASATVLNSNGYLNVSSGGLASATIVNNYGGLYAYEGGTARDTTLKELGIQKMPFHVVAIKRNGSMIIPHGDDMIKHLDIVYFMASKQDLPRIKQMVGKEDYRDVKNIAIMGGGKVAYHTVLQAPGYM